MSDAQKPGPSLVYISAAEVDLLIASLEKKAEFAENLLKSHYTGEKTYHKPAKLLLNELVCLIGMSISSYRDLLKSAFTTKSGTECYKLEQSQVLSLSSFVLSVTAATDDLASQNVSLELH